MVARIYQGTGPLDAYLVRDWLERNGIRAFVRGDRALGEVFGPREGRRWPSVWVFQDDREAAEALLVEADRPVPEEAVACTSCGEDNPLGTTRCWMCREPLTAVAP